MDDERFVAAARSVGERGMRLLRAHGLAELGPVASGSAIQAYGWETVK